MKRQVACHRPCEKSGHTTTKPSPKRAITGKPTGPSAESDPAASAPSTGLGASWPWTSVAALTVRGRQRTVPPAMPRYTRYTTRARVPSALTATDGRVALVRPATEASSGSEISKEAGASLEIGDSVAVRGRTNTRDAPSSGDWDHATYTVLPRTEPVAMTGFQVDCAAGAATSKSPLRRPLADR